jgi:hypothetical protein
MLRLPHSCISVARGEAVWLGAVEAPDAATAIEKTEFKVPATRLMAIRR